jgi:antirestriction protein ArdC
MFAKTRNAGWKDREPRDHYAEVTNQVIAALEAGAPPWRKPWDARVAGGPAPGAPRNAATGARYHGINTIILALSPLACFGGDPRWATYKQAAERGWQVRKGERGTTAYFFKRIEVADRAGRDGGDGDGTRRIPLLRAFTLFHASQIDGIPAFVPPTVEEAPWRAPESVDTIIANSEAEVRIGGDKAFYAPLSDHIQMPPPNAFKSAAAWSSVLLHEAAHWTSSESRLNRNLMNAFGSPDYSREELRAELAQMMVCSELNIDDCDFSNNASYIAGWLTALRSDRKEIFRAAADAQRIADYLLAFHPDYAARNSAPTDDGAADGTDPAGAADATDDQKFAA